MRCKVLIPMQPIQGVKVSGPRPTRGPLSSHSGSEMLPSSRERVGIVSFFFHIKLPLHLVVIRITGYSLGHLNLALYSHVGLDLGPRNSDQAFDRCIPLFAHSVTQGET